MSVAAATYFCRRCQKPSAGAICPDCYGTAVVVADGDTLAWPPPIVLPPLPILPPAAAPPAPPPAAPPAAGPAAARAAATAAAPQPPQPAPRPVAEPLTGLAATPGAAQLAEYLADGFEIFLVGGIGGSRQDPPDGGLPRPGPARPGAGGGRPPDAHQPHQHRGPPDPAPAGAGRSSSTPRASTSTGSTASPKAPKARRRSSCSTWSPAASAA